MYFNDESLFSFLFRTQLIYGYPDYRNLFRNSGAARENPVARKELSGVYRRFDEKRLYFIINRLDHGKVSFSHPSDDLKELEQFYSQGYTFLVPRRLKSIRFCFLCIQESYNIYGVSYLKSLWEFTSYCKRHRLPLSETIPRSYKKSVENVLKLISGTLPDASETFSIVINKYNQHYKKDETKRPFADLYISPCASYLMEQWIYNNRKMLLAMLPARMWDPDGVRLLNELTKSPSSFVEKMFNNRNDENMSEFKFFVSKNTEVITEKYGVLQNDSFSFRVIKAKI